MATIYALRRPMALADLVAAALGWWLGEDGMLTDGTNWAAPEWQGGMITEVTRYGASVVDTLVEALDAVSEHDYDSPDHARLFPDDVN